jgi:phosphatidylinositol glycan class F
MTSKQLPAAATPAPFFPLASYTSLVGVHASLQLFTALFLPRTSLDELVSSLLGGTYTPPVTTVRSADRPQHAFLAPLTADPLATLGWLCAGVLVLQGWWAVRVHKWAQDYHRALLGQDGKRDEPAEMAEGDRDRAARRRAEVLRRVGDVGGFAVLTAGLYHVMLVLFGAPITSHVGQTALLATLLSLLTTIPTAYVYHPPFHVSALFGKPKDNTTRRLTWVKLFSEFALTTPIDVAVAYPAVGALVGAWAGAIPLALDWDRPWQAYPLPPAYGALLGSVLGALAGCAVNNVRFLAQLSRDREAARTEHAHPKRETSGAASKKGQEAVDEMKRSIQATLGGFGMGARVVEVDNDKKKKKGKK